MEATTLLSTGLNLSALNDEELAIVYEEGDTANFPDRRLVLLEVAHRRGAAQKGEAYDVWLLTNPLATAINFFNLKRAMEVAERQISGCQKRLEQIEIIHNANDSHSLVYDQFILDQAVVTFYWDQFMENPPLDLEIHRSEWIEKLKQAQLDLELAEEALDAYSY